MVTALVLNKKYNFSKIVFHYMVENITSKSKTWVYPRFVQMMLDHAYPDLERDENNDLLEIFCMDNESLKQLARYHLNHPEPSTKAEFFGFIKDKNYQDPDPIDHQKWRNDKEMKEKSYADELKTLEGFKETRNEWFLKEEKNKRSGKSTPKVQAEEGSSSQPKQKRQKKNVETMLVDESEEEDEGEAEAEVNVEGDVRLSPESAKLLKSLTDYNAETEKTAGDEGDNEDKSSSSSSDEDIDETERAKRIQAEIEKEKQLKRKRKEDKDDELYNPSPEHVIESQTLPSSGGRKKTSARKSVTSSKAARRKLIVKNFPNNPVNIPLDDIGDFDFANNEQVKRLEKKVEEVLIENKKLVDREKKLEKRVKSVEAENSSLLNKVEADQAEIDILKVKVAELEEEKARRDEQNKYFELKNNELESAKAMKEHEIYMLNKVLENLLGKSVEQRFEEIEVEEVRARCQAEIDAQMKNEGKGVEGIPKVSERSIIPSTEDVLIDDVIDDEEEVEEDDDEDDDDEDKADDADDVFSACSHSDDDDDDNGQGGTGIKVTEASNEENVEDYLHDDVN
ncbi:glutamic acid-rich protein-like [Helianthus annuus]|uniref:glutamic acid-rich protein-like n=1 Tax=Helianthus annuus TaxID=4232 RepID=UPI000B9024E8|nr:glutamic acid-rich protein-like [Helianthus annuus]